MMTIADKFDKCVELFNTSLDKNAQNLKMNFFGISYRGCRTTHLFRKDDVVDLRSVSKIITSLTLGALINEKTVVNNNQLKLDSRVADIFPSIQGYRHLDRRWNDVRVYHLLNNTIGHSDGFFFRRDLRDVSPSEYVDYIFSRPIENDPGSHFSYSNVGPFLVSVILQDSGIGNLSELANDKILTCLGVEAHWKKYGVYSGGCSGLMLNGADLLTLGEWILDQYLNESSMHGWLSKAAASQVLTPLMYDPSRVFPKYSYGFGFWVCKNGVFYCDGTDGQYLIVCPKQRLVMATTGCQSDMKPITRAMTPIVEYLSVMSA